jgi:hypothetical protein
VSKRISLVRLRPAIIMADIYYSPSRTGSSGTDIDSFGPACLHKLLHMLAYAPLAANSGLGVGVTRS